MAEPLHAIAIILAAGEGRRVGTDGPKALLELRGTPIVALAVRSATASSLVDGVVVTAPAGLEEAFRAAAGDGAEVIAGGTTRQDSVLRALGAVPDGASIVVVHDAARPFASVQLFDDVIAAAAAGSRVERVAGAIPVIAVPDTVKRVEDGFVVATERRERLVLAQTPQAFDLAALREAHERAAIAGRSFTDDAAIVEWAGHRVRTIPGDPVNLKITTPADVVVAEAWMERSGG